MCALCAVVAIKITTYRYMYCFRPVFTVLQTFQKWTVPVFCLQGPVSLEAPAKLTKGLPLRPALIESWTCWKSLHQVPVTWGNSMLLVQETHPETFFLSFFIKFPLLWNHCWNHCPMFLQQIPNALARRIAAMRLSECGMSISPLRPNSRWASLS